MFCVTGRPNWPFWRQKSIFNRPFSNLNVEDGLSDYCYNMKRIHQLIDVSAEENQTL